MSRPGRLPSLGLNWLLVQAVLMNGAFAVVRPMVSYRALDLGAGAAVLGALAAAFAVLPLLLAFAIGRQADRLGPGRLLVGAPVVMTTGAVLALLAPGFALLVVASGIMGFAHLLSMVGQQTVIARLDSDLDRDRGFGVLTAAMSVGQLLAPPIALTLADRLASSAWSAAQIGLAVAALCAMAALPFAVRRRVHRSDRAAVPAERPSSREAFAVLIRTNGMWQAIFISGTVLAALDLLLAYLPAWAEERGVSVTVVGWLLGLRALVALLSRALLVRLIKAFSRRWTFVGSLVGGVLGLALLPFVGVAGAAALMLLLGVGLGVAQPLTMATVSNLSAPHLRGTAVGLRMTANRLTQTVLPPAIGLFAAGAGSSGVFVGAAAVLAVAALTALPGQPG